MAQIQNHDKNFQQYYIYKLQFYISGMSNIVAQEDNMESKSLKRTVSLEFLSDEFEKCSSPENDSERHPLAKKKGGGLIMQDKQRSFQKMTGQVIKELGSKLMSGKLTNLMNIRKPIQMCKEVSFLESIANEQLYASKFLRIGASCNPLEQIQLIGAYLIAGLHVNGPVFLSKAPMEPLLGETLQLEKSDGTMYYAEQFSIDPSISRFQIFGPGSCFQVHGANNFQVQFKQTLNTVIGKSNGHLMVKFANGNEYVCTTPECIITGLIMGERVMNYRGNQTIYCKQTNLHADIIFHYNSESVISFVNRKLTTVFYKPKQAIQLSDFVDIQVYKKKIIDGDEVIIPLSTGEGSWLQGVKFDSRMLWRINDRIEEWKRQQNLLVSDSSQRGDLQLLLKKKLEEAQLMKKYLEDQDEFLEKLRTSRRI